MQGQRIKDYLTLSSKKEFRISITNSLLSPGWMNHNEVHRILPRRKMHTRFPLPPWCHFQCLLSVLLLILYLLFSVEDGNLRSIAEQEVQSMPTIFALLKLITFTPSHKTYSTRWVYHGGTVTGSLQKCVEKRTGSSMQCVFSSTDLGKVT